LTRTGVMHHKTPTVECERQREVQEIFLWMAAVDAAFEAGNVALAEDLDAALEIRLDDLDHRLSALDEGGDVLDGDNHVGIEDQFIALWSEYLLGVGSFGPSNPASELAEHLRSILRDEAQTGPYSPGPFLEQAEDGYLLELAADLWNERQAYILRTR
jgi:hypothetical protein